LSLTRCEAHRCRRRVSCVSWWCTTMERILGWLFIGVQALAWGHKRMQQIWFAAGLH
jgi:hypothetical protein